MFEELKKRRTELGKSIEEISKLTKIKKSYIEAIEEGNFSELPIEIYTKSYIKIYSELLGVDSKKLIEEYEKFLNSKRSSQERDFVNLIERNEEFTKDKNVKSEKYPKWLVKTSISAVVILLIFIILNYERRKEVLPPPPPEKIEKIETKEETSNLSVKDREEKPNLQTLKIQATDKVWMRITIDEREKREFLLNSGQDIELQAQKSFKAHIGNAGGVKVYFNGDYLGKLGETGQVVYLKLPKE